MPLLQWKAEYTVDEVELDNDHREFFNILNTAYESVINSIDVKSVLSKVDELLVLLRRHISAEEQYLMESCYHEIDAHMAEHRQFMANIESLKANHHASSLEATQELIVVLGNWILHHILAEDKKYQVALSKMSESTGN